MSIPAQVKENRQELTDAAVAAELLRLLSKALRVVRIHGSNDVSRRVEAEFLALLGSYAERWGSLALTVSDQRIRLRNECVFETEERGSLAELLSRDGIRRLTFVGDLSGEELHDFILLLHRAARPASSVEDLATLLWERNFHSILHVAINEIDELEGKTAAEAHVADPGLNGESGAALLDAARMLAMSQPVACVPVGGARTDADLREILAEALEEERDAGGRTIAQLAAEVCTLENEPTHLAFLRQALIELLQARAGAGQGEVAMRIAAALGQLAQTSFADVAAVRELRDAASGALAEPECLDALLQALDRSVEPRAQELSEFLESLGPRVLPLLLTRLSSLGGAELRRAIADLFARAGQDAIEVLSTKLDPDAELGPEGRDQLLTLVELHPELAGSAAVQRLLDDPDAAVRQQAGWALGPFQDGAVGQAWLRLLEDGDAEVYKLAVGTLGQSARPDLAARIEASIAADSFVGRSPGEKRAAFAALAELAGDGAIPRLLSVVQPGRSWFGGTGRTESTEAALEALRSLGTPAARDALDGLRRSSDRKVRAAVSRALGEEPIA